MKDLEKSAFMHRQNLHERVRKGQVRCPPKILKRIDAAFAAGQMEAVINLCNLGGLGRKAGNADYPTNADIKRVMDAQNEWFSNHEEDTNTDIEVNAKLLKAIKNRTL